MSTLIDRELENILGSGEIGVIFLGGVLPENKVVTAADLTGASTGAEIKALYELEPNAFTDALNTKLANMLPDEERINAIGNNPILLLEMEPGGTAAQVQMFDKNSGHAVSTMEYIAAEEKVLFALMNKTTGMWRTLLELMPDGTATIGNGMTQAQIATVDDIMTPAEVDTRIREYSTIVVQDCADPKKPTTPEAITAFKTLPNMDWSKNDTFYIRHSTGGDKMCYLVYVADGATSEATAGDFYVKDMTKTLP